MVWGAMKYGKKGPLTFVEQGVKINAAYYRTEILEKTLLPWAEEKIGRDEIGVWREEWIFQQDGATSHTANATQNWLQQKVPNFIAKEEWPSNSCDANPIENLWAIMKEEVGAQEYETVDELKEAIEEAWDRIPQETIDILADSFPDRLLAILGANGGHFESI
jgi:transposase